MPRHPAGHPQSPPLFGSNSHFINGICTAIANGFVFGVTADFGQCLPAPFAFLSLGQGRHHANTCNIIKGIGTIRRITRDQFDVRCDGNFGKIKASKRFDIFGRRINRRRGIKACANAFFCAFKFKRTRSQRDAACGFLPIWSPAHHLSSHRKPH